MRKNATPDELGYSFPPEWHPHTATWLSWPRPEGISFPGRYHLVLENLCGLVNVLQKHERVEINVPNANYRRIVTATLKEHGVPLARIGFHEIRTNECWCRDHGPAFVLKGSGKRARAAIVDWGFNAWGGKYPPWSDDDAVPTKIGAELGLPVFDAALVMEGGSVDFNGEGTILTTTSCLLHKNRNPGVGKKAIEGWLKRYYGQRHVIWLGEGIAGDDTDGHIDDLARFIRKDTIAIGIEDDPKDENYQLLQDNLQKLRRAKDQDGRRFRIVELPMPGKVEIEGQRVPATYLNFYFVNGALLVPTYGDKKRDRLALGLLQRHLPDREVIGVDCRQLIWGLGAIHCLTQQQPRW